jgi:small subunit ribosomal protein S1
MAKTSAETVEEPFSTGENFAEMLEESFRLVEPVEGSVLKGSVIAIENDMAVIDVGLKSVGRVSVREFSPHDEEGSVQVGDEVDVYLERYENRHGDAVLSREKARREEAWTLLEKAFKETTRVEGIIFGRVKGGFTVDLSGAVAFLPGSQVDIRPVRDVTPLMGTPQPFQILKMDRSRGNIVVSRRAVLEESRAEARAELIANLKEGQILEGIVKNITDYGAFIDLGGVDGLLHITDISWRRINHPSEALNIGETVNVQVIRFNAETQRISLGMKQLEADPWEGVEAKYPISARFTGRITNITDYGAFVELEPGVEALVHVSEMSWTKKNIHPGKIVSTSQEVEVTVLDVDAQRRRISLGLKQCMENPWETFADNHPIGEIIEGEIKNVTEFGLFVGLPGNIDGMVHMSDLDWHRPGDAAIADYNKGAMCKVKVLDIDVEKERVSLGVKQLSEDPFEGRASQLKKGKIVTCTVAAVQDKGIEVDIEGVRGFIRRSDLARDRSEQRPDRFALGEKVDAKITSVDRSGRQISLSIKAREIEEEKKAMAQYGSSDSGASLGDILGAALSRVTGKQSEETPADKSEEEADEKPKAEAPKKAKTKAKAKPAKKAEAEAETEVKADDKADETTEAAGQENGEAEKTAEETAEKTKDE